MRAVAFAVGHVQGSRVECVGNRSGHCKAVSSAQYCARVWHAHWMWASHAAPMLHELGHLALQLTSWVLAMQGGEAGTEAEQCG